MKTFLFIFIFALSLNADSMYNGNCVQSAYSFAGQYYVTTTKEGYTSAVISSNYAQIISYNDKFYYDSSTQRCYLITSRDSSSSNNQVLISSLTGILIGFTILFFAIFLTIKVGSRK